MFKNTFLAIFRNKYYIFKLFLYDEMILYEQIKKLITISKCESWQDENQVSSDRMETESVVIVSALSASLSSYSKLSS